MKRIEKHSTQGSSGLNLRHQLGLLSIKDLGELMLKIQKNATSLDLSYNFHYKLGKV
jgi:hypothetical protein